MRARLGSTPCLVVSLWLIWGSAFVAIKIGLGYATPEAFALLRVSSALVVLAPAMLLLRLRHGPPMADPRVHRYGLVLGATNVAVFLTLQNLGMVDAGVALSSVLIYTQPLLVAIGARLLLGEAMTVRRLIGLVCGWAGVVALVAGELDVGVAPLGSILLLLGAATAWSSGTLVFKSLPDDVDLWRLLLWQNLYGLGPMVVLAALRGVTIDWGLPLVVAMLWAGVAASIGGFGLLFVLLRRGEAGVVSSWIFAVPIIAGFLGVVLLAERPHLGLVTGGAAVAAGIYLVNTSRRTRESVPQSP